MKAAHLDCMSGISGDMTLGALVDVGVDLEEIQRGIDSLGLPSCQLTAEEVKRKGFRATKVHVNHEPEHAHRHLHHITEMIDGSQLTTPQKDLAKQIFTRLGEAEAKVHGTTIRKVHFHEVGAVDSIADIVGCAIGWISLGVESVTCSPLPTGHGFINIAHGRVSVPAPATAELLKDVPLAPSPVEAELTTPTGAAIATTLATEYSAQPSLRIERVGYGAGDADFDDQANVLRLLVGETTAAGAASELESDRVWVLETNLDDESGEAIAHCLARLSENGAVDSYITPIQMKKGRPGSLLTVLAQAGDISRLEEIIFCETSTLGIRRWPADRHKLTRRPVDVSTPWGNVRGKVAQLPTGEHRFSPEFDDCRVVSEAQGIALREVYEAARRAYRELNDPDE